MLPHLDGNRQAHVSETTLLGDGPQYARRPAEGTLTGAPVDTKCNKITDEENSKMQLWFNSATREAFDIPEGYQQVTVLIIKWKADIDELKTQDEVCRS